VKTISVKVQSDYIQSLARVRKPLVAVAELVWNGLDADATEVRVAYTLNSLGVIEAVRISDDGHGLPYEEAVPAFENLGGSWKRPGSGTRTKMRNRLLHGRLGRGRFRAFALGGIVTWHTRYRSGADIFEYTIRGSASRPTNFELADPGLSESTRTGTDVLITGFDRNFPSLLGEQALSEMTQYFALYLRQYPGAAVVYNGSALRPASIERYSQNYQLTLPELDDGRDAKATLTIIEWQTEQERSLFLCDDAGFALEEIPVAIHAPGFVFTAYLKSDALRRCDEHGALLPDLNPNVKAAVDIARAKLREHFRQRAAEQAGKVVEQWKAEKIYPYEGEPRNIIEVTERQVFDVCAFNLSSYLPDFDRADNKSKQLSLRLLKHALAVHPGAVCKILEDVLNLPQEKQKELAELLEKTSLAAIINASQMVANRLAFLAGLEQIVFDEECRKTLLERRQLHRILAANNTWVFGEEFNLTVDDESLNEVLKKHLRFLGRDSNDNTPVLREDGSKGVVDLMLSRLLPLPRAEEREHLVVELKRPKEPISLRIMNQVQSYAFAVAEDERFRDTRTRWHFWALSNQLEDSVRRQSCQRNRPEGLFYDDARERICIWVKTWGEIINECKARLRFFQERLEFSCDKDEGLAYLRRTHEKYLPEHVKTTVALSDTSSDTAVPSDGDAGGALSS